MTVPLRSTFKPSGIIKNLRISTYRLLHIEVLAATSYISRPHTLAPVAINLLNSHPADRPHTCPPADMFALTTCRIHLSCCRRSEDLTCQRQLTILINLGTPITRRLLHSQLASICSSGCAHCCVMMLLGSLPEYRWSHSEGALGSST